MRLTLNRDEVLELMKIISSVDDTLHAKIKKQYEADISKDITKKQSSIQEATKKREHTAKAKITNAINILRMENKELTPYAISKVSGCSYNTVKKYYTNQGGNK